MGKTGKVKRIIRPGAVPVFFADTRSAEFGRRRTYPKTHQINGPSQWHRAEHQMGPSGNKWHRTASASVKTRVAFANDRAARTHNRVISPRYNRTGDVTLPRPGTTWWTVKTKCFYIAAGTARPRTPVGGAQSLKHSSETWRVIIRRPPAASLFQDSFCDIGLP